MDQPQPCTKCNNLPEDILMLACGHDLCLNCASERLNFELKKRKPANVHFKINYFRVSFANFVIRERPQMLRVSHNFKNSFQPIIELGLGVTSLISNLYRANTTDLMRKIRIQESTNSHHRITGTIALFTTNRNKRILEIMDFPVLIVK